MPLYPGRPADARGRRDERTPSGSPLAEAPTLTKIPVLPISYGDAQPLLAALGGPVAPEAWRGALPITYHLGPGPARVHLEARVRLGPGAGPRRDRALPGAERARRVDHPRQPPRRLGERRRRSDQRAGGRCSRRREALGELAKSGWRPKRTIVYAAWDGEEPGLLGSTEWVETHADELPAEGRRLRQLRRQRPRLPRGRRLAHAGALHQRGGARRAPIPETERLRALSAARAPDVVNAPRRASATEARERRRPAHRGPRLRLGLHALPAAPRHRLAQPRLRRRGRRRLLPLDLRLVRPLHPLRRSDLRLRRGAGPDGRPRRPAPGRAPTSCRSSSPPSRDTVGRYVDEVVKLAGRTLREETAESATARSRGRDRGAAADPNGDRSCRRRTQSAGAATSTSRRSRTRSPRSRAARRRYDGPPRPAAAGHALAAADAMRRSTRSSCATERALTPREGLPAPALVPPPGLRARLLHRLRRQDPARRARGHRAARLEGGRGAGGRRSQGPRSLRRSGRQGDGGDRAGFGNGGRDGGEVGAAG